MDLADVAGNAADGCHIASMGGTWMTAIYGFAGMRDYKGQISFRPLQPLRPIMRIRFRLAVRDQQIEVEITRKAVTYSLRRGKGLTVRHHGEEIDLIPGKRVSRAFEPSGEEEPIRG